ncbi:Crp/Fnr family transcriptional regulator [Flavobacterium sp.]|uniref:Crp/Fnr family transcriptional regulator n=1 Tax=Flavobacterium sp. TaxID=239 RepID=UPI0026200D77|nr:Crp/Fnr family transcriptional regulator [Flavobacterium sp.]
MDHTNDLEIAIETISKNYSPLTVDCKNDLKKASKLVCLDKSSEIVKEGQFADKLYFIVNGCVRAFYNKDGKEITDWFAFEGDFISSRNSFYQKVISNYNIELLEQTTFLEISREAILILLDKHHCFERLGRIAITKTMLQLQERIVSMQFETAQQKYENLIKLRPDILQRVPLTFIASHLGITLETLSRIRSPKNRI